MTASEARLKVIIKIGLNKPDKDIEAIFYEYNFQVLRDIKEEIVKVDDTDVIKSDYNEGYSTGLSRATAIVDNYIK